MGLDSSHRFETPGELHSARLRVAGVAHRFQCNASPWCSAASRNLNYGRLISPRQMQKHRNTKYIYPKLRNICSKFRNNHENSIKILRKNNKNHEKITKLKIHEKKTFQKHVLWIFVLSPSINVWASKSFSRWTKLIDHAEISSKTCSVLLPCWISILQKTRFHCIFDVFWNTFFPSIWLFFPDLCYSFCNNLLLSWLFRNSEQIFRHLGFISVFGCFTFQHSNGPRSMQPTKLRRWLSEGLNFDR